MEFRQKGINLLSSIFKKEKNIKIIEDNVYKVCGDNEDTYLQVMHEVSTLFMSEQLTLPKILKNIKSNHYIWNNPFFDNIRNSLIEQDNFIISPFEIDEGVLQCDKCGSKKTFSYSKQTRSGDESTTVFAVYANCKATWKT